LCSTTRHNGSTNAHGMDLRLLQLLRHKARTSPPSVQPTASHSSATTAALPAAVGQPLQLCGSSPPTTLNWHSQRPPTPQQMAPWFAASSLVAGMLAVIVKLFVACITNPERNGSWEQARQALACWAITSEQHGAQQCFPLAPHGSEPNNTECWWQNTLWYTAPMVQVPLPGPAAPTRAGPPRPAAPVRRRGRDSAPHCARTCLSGRLSLPRPPGPGARSAPLRRAR
jgi:hypothetical protein